MRAWTALFVIVVACGSPSPAPLVRPPAPAPSAAPAPPPTAPAAAPAVDPAFAALNLDFEQLDGDRPAKWNLIGKGYELLAVADEHRGGAHALRIRSTTTPVDFATAISGFPAAPYLGKHLRLHGFVKTADATGGAAMFLRVDGGVGAFDNMGEHAISGTTPWGEATVEVDVPPGAEQIVFGPMLVGTGTAWFDDLRFEVTTAEPPKPVVLGGSVTAGGAAVADADVALVTAHGILAHTRTDARGHFDFHTTAGTWGISAQHAGLVGGFLDSVRYTADTTQLHIDLAASGGVTVHGHTSAPPAPGAYVAIGAVSEHEGDVFAVPVAPDGTFEALLPRGDRYYVAAIENAIDTAQLFPRTGDRVDVTLRITDTRPAPADVVAYIAAHAIPLTTVEAGHGFADMAKLGALVGDAHVVALGEATHGSREFFQMKHRMLEYLVAQRGFTVFALEANQPECRAINAYVLHGTGTARDALRGIYFWTWNTEEVLAMIEWMRAWNADAKHAKKVEFVGFDMQTATVAYANVDAFTHQVAPADAAALVAPLGPVRGEEPAFAKASTADRAAAVAGLTALAAAFDAHRAAWTKATSAAAFADARHDVTILQQFARLAAGGPTSFDVRDDAMADNLAWLRAQHPGARFVVWAHNGHIANELAAFPNMGGHLRARWKADYVNLGFLFGDGAFQAMSESGHLGEFKLGPAPDYQASAAFARTGKPLLVLDLRALPKTGAVHDWFTAPHPVRETGAVFSSEKAMTEQLVLPALYDAVIYVATTTRAREL